MSADYGKRSAFYEYCRALRVADYNESISRQHFVTWLRAKAERIAAEFPDFPEAYERLCK